MAQDPYAQIAKPLGQSGEDDPYAGIASQSAAAPPNSGLAPAAGAPPSKESFATSLPAPSALSRGTTAFGAQLPTIGDVNHMMNDKPVAGEGDDSILPESISRAGKGWLQSTITEPAERIHEGDYAGAIGEAAPGLLQAGSAGRSLIGAVPEELATAPVRGAARATEGIVNSSPLRYVRGAVRIMTPADDARKMIRIPGRDFGLDIPANSGVPFPERPLPAIAQARGLQTGARIAEEPSTALATVPTPQAQPETALAVSPKGKIGGRFVLMPEEVQQAEQVAKIAAKRASERGMQYAAGMRPSGAKISAP
jgi:hypothetical protein